MPFFSTKPKVDPHAKESLPVHTCRCPEPHEIFVREPELESRDLAQEDCFSYVYSWKLRLGDALGKEIALLRAQKVQEVDKEMIGYRSTSMEAINKDLLNIKDSIAAQFHEQAAKQHRRRLDEIEQSVKDVEQKRMTELQQRLNEEQRILEGKLSKLRQKYKGAISLIAGTVSQGVIDELKPVPTADKQST